MERKTLKFLRLLVPGLTIIFEFLPLLNQLQVEFKMGESWLTYTILVIPALVLGAIYHMIKARHFITNYSHRKIDLNITSSLLKIYNKEISQEQTNKLKDKKLKHIFYNLVDNDKSLTAKSELIYFNGVLWTSTADVFLLSILSTFVYIVVGLVLNNTIICIFGILFAAIGLLAFSLHVVTVFRHFNLSNDQLEFIETNYLKELKQKIDGVLQQMSGTS